VNLAIELEISGKPIVYFRGKRVKVLLQHSNLHELSTQSDPELQPFNLLSALHYYLKKSMIL
jgi:hypothetical protein